MNADPLIGRQLANFRIERLLGRGGMAQVYYGWDVRLERPVAIKVIDARYRSDPAYAGRFVREAQAIARWRHEHIVQIFHADDEDGLYYFVMEYIEGKDLGTLMKEAAASGRLIPHQDVLRIGRAIAHALDYAHQRGVIHRDVKPANILIDRGGRIILTDFGLAMDVAQGSLGEVFGSPHYIAPEQARRSSDAVAASDLYSTGVILYELLTGRVPFDDPSPASLALQHLTLPPPPPRGINPRLNAETEKVLLTALAKSSADRYQSGAELVTALDSALSGWGPEATQKRETRKERPQAARRKSLPAVLWLGGGLAALLLVLGILLVLFSGLPGERESVSPTPALEAGSAEGERAALPTSTPLPATDIPPAPEAGTEHTPEEAVSEATPPSTAIEPPPEVAQTNPTATILNPTGYRVVFFYSERSFYMWNPGDRRLSISSIAFEALDGATGQAAPYRYEGDLWAAYYDQLMEGNCNALEIAELAAPVRPPQCPAYNAVRSPAASSPWIFWQAREEISQFRVLWEGVEIGRCEISLETCEVYLP